MQGKTFTMELAGKTLTIETGKYCEQAGGSAFVREKLPVFGRVGRSLLQILRECRRMSFLFHGVVRLVQR